MSTWTFDPASGRYRHVASGKYASEAAVRLAIDKLAEQASSDMASLSARLRAGSISLSDWQTSMMATIKTAHVAAYVVAHGGRARMTQSDWGYLGQRIRAQYVALRNFANAIEAGTVPLNGRIDARARLYGQAARALYEATRARDSRGWNVDEEKNILHANESCSECRDQTALGWVASGTLIPIGSRTCLVACRCTITRRRAPESRAITLRLVG